MTTGRWRAMFVLIALAVFASACAARNDSSSGDEDEGSEAGEGSGSGEESGGDAGGSAFGSLTELCGPGDFSVEPGEQGLDNGMLNLGVATDRSAQVRPGLNKEVWDASLAYSEWCNEQGGIGGLEINVVELSGSLLEVESAMATACTDVFAMVGGGFAQDNLEFSGKEESDFHLCGLVDVPAFAASAEKSGSNGMVQPVPNTPDTELNTILRDHAELNPEQAEKAVIVYGQLPTMETGRDKYEAALEDVGIELVGTVSYPVAGVMDWTQFAVEVAGTGAGTLLFVGEPTNLASLLDSLREQGWEGTPVLNSNMYDAQLFGDGNAGPEGALVRMPAHPFEEAADWPATQQYLDLLDDYVPDSKAGLLGVQSMSAWLLFTVAANACAEANDGVLQRECILEQAAEQQEWTGGGLHAPQDPASWEEAATSPCSALVVVEDGEFVRAYPELGGDDDDVDGFHCPENGVTELDVGDVGAVDPDRAI